MLHDGKLVQTACAADISVPRIIEKMVGKNPAAPFARTVHTAGEVLMKVENLTPRGPAAATSSITSRSRCTPARSSAFTA